MESNMNTCHWMNGAGLPVFMKTGNPSANRRDSGWPAIDGFSRAEAQPGQAGRLQAELCS